MQYIKDDVIMNVTSSSEVTFISIQHIRDAFKITKVQTENNI